MREFNEITGMEHLVPCVTHGRPIINISSFAPLLLTLFSHPASPKPRASHWQGRECSRRYAESKSAHDPDCVLSVSWKDHTSAESRWRGQGRGGRSSCLSLPSKCVLSVLGKQMLLVERKDEECCQTVPEEMPTVINPLPKIPNPAQVPAWGQSRGLFAQTRSWNKSSGLSDGSKKGQGSRWLLGALAPEQLFQDLPLEQSHHLMDKSSTRSVPGPGLDRDEGNQFSREARVGCGAWHFIGTEQAGWMNALNSAERSRFCISPFFLSSHCRAVLRERARALGMQLASILTLPLLVSWPWASYNPSEPWLPHV